MILKGKIYKTLILISLMLFTLSGCSFSSGQNIQTDTSEASAQDNEDAPEIPEVEEKGTVVILATGGTIAGSGEKGKETGYKSGELSVDALVEAVPELAEVANIEAIQVCNVNSDDITSEIWIELANMINEMAKNDNIAGFVITHGTDTMEETAYFLDMTVKTDKPVVLTGSMRPATAISADGPMNLYQAVCVAASEESKGKGVLVTFSDRIFSAREVKKISTYSVMAVSAGETGSIGIIRDNNVMFYEEPAKKHTLDTEFDVSKESKLPNAQILYFEVDADPGILEYAAAHSDGLVIAGAGAGEFSEEFIDVINKLEIPVVISSRIDDGIITQDAVLCENTVAANDLPAQKAVILLRLALMNKTTSQEELIRIFNTY